MSYLGININPINWVFVNKDDLTKWLFPLVSYYTQCKCAQIKNKTIEWNIESIESEIYIDDKICLFCLFDVVSELICSYK